MGFMGSLFSGAPDIERANIVEAANKQQADQAFANTQQGIQQQQDFVNATAASNGLQNQSNVFNQLQGVANGTGPNPAQAALAQATGANVANQAALMAGQRGAGANAGLLARQAAMQGGAIQQQAAGQGATMQANQSLNALNQLGGIAGQQVGQQAGALQGYNQAAQGQQGNVLSAIGNQNAANVSATQGYNQQRQQQFQGDQKLAGGFLNSIGGAAAQAFTGGAKPMAMGGSVEHVNTPMPAASASVSMDGVFTPPQGGAAKEPEGKSDLKMPEMGAQFNAAPAAPSLGVSPPTPAPSSALTYDTPAPLFAQGGQVMAEGPQSFFGRHLIGLQSGGHVPGQAKHPGDTTKNDTVPALLSPGEIVIPRSVAQGPDPAKAAAKFVSAIMARKGLK